MKDRIYHREETRIIKQQMISSAKLVAHFSSQYLVKQAPGFSYSTS